MSTNILKKSKRVIATGMAAVMMFAFTSTAFAFTDIGKLENNTQDAIGKLTALEVIGGYADGTFKPEKQITRAEFAKIASGLAGMKDSGDVLQNTASKFKDVKTGEWYTGWINVATSKGLLAGYPDGTFRPNQFISQQEVITVMMRTLGYNDNLPGAWPIDYINQASKLDVFDGVKFVGGAVAIRGDVAVLGSNTLESNMVAWSKDKEDFTDKGNSLLTESFKGAVVEEAKISSLTNKSSDKGEMTLNASTNTTTKAAESFTVNKDTVLSTGMELADLQNQTVDVIYTVEKGVKYAKFIDVTSKMVKAEKAVVDGKNIKLDGKSYPVSENTKGNDIDVTANNVYYYAYVNNDGQVYTVIPDAKVTDFTVGVFKEYKDNTKEIVMFEDRFSVKNTNSIIMKNGKPVTVEDLKKYDVLKYSSDKSVIYVEEMASGKLERTYGSNITSAVAIDGVKYPSVKKAIDNEDKDVSSYTDYLNTTVKYAVNPNGTISTIFVGNINTESTNMYGVVTDFTLNTGAYAGKVETVTVFNQEGKSVKYNVKKGDIFPNGATDVALGNLIKFRLDSEGVIDKSYDVAVKTNNDKTADVENDRITLNGSRYALDDKVLIFNVDEDKNGKTIVNTVNYKDLQKDDTIYTQGITYTLDGNNLKVLVLEKYKGGSGVRYGFVKDFGYATSDIDKAVTFYGDEEVYELDETGIAAANLDKKGFYKYTVNGDKAKLEAAPTNLKSHKVLYTDRDLFTVQYDDNGVAKQMQFVTTADTYIARISLDGSNAVDEVNTNVDISTDDEIYVVLDQDPARSDEALFVIIIEK